MYKLYYSPGACSMAIHVVLNELNLPFTLENVGGGKNRSPEFLAINSLGTVPVLETEDGKIMREGAVILIHLLDKYNHNFLPKANSERDAAMEALMFCNATLHPAYSRGFFILKNVANPEVKKHLLEVVVKNINKLWEEVERRLSKSEYLAGDKITVGDILMTVIANWSHNFPDVKIGEKAKELIKKIIARPAYKKALEVEKVEYKAVK